MIRVANEQTMIVNAVNRSYESNLLNFVLDNGVSIHVCGNRSAFVEWGNEQLVLTWIGETQRVADGSGRILLDVLNKRTQKIEQLKDPCSLY